MWKLVKRLYSVVAWTVLLLPFSAAHAVNHWQLDMYKGVTPISHDIYWLHTAMMIVCLFIGIGVFSVLIYSLVKHRKSKGHVAANFHENTKVEIIWTTIPALILVALAIPATLVLIRTADTRDADVTIKITGLQWKWHYHYLNEDVSFYSNISTPMSERLNQSKKNQWYLLEVDKPVVVPIHRKIRFLTTSDDVIHSWWVPELGVKRDALPGFINEAWAEIEKPGVYRGQCTELCGPYHGFMPVVVKAVTPKEYDAWVKKTQAEARVDKRWSDLPAETLMAEGKNIYDTQCSACHGLDGKGGIGPPMKADSVVTGYPVERHIQIILNGVRGSAMQAFKDQLNDKELAEVITFERNGFGNITGDLVQPNDVRRVRQAGPMSPMKQQTGGQHHE